MENIIQEFHTEEYGKIKTEMSFLPVAIRSASTQASEQIISNTCMIWQKLTLKITLDTSFFNKIKSYCQETVKSIEISEPFETISIDEFQKKYLGYVDEKGLWEQFKTDLLEEVAECKISKIKYYRIISKLTQKQLAEKLETQQPNIVRIEKIGYKSDIDTLKKLGKIFKIDYKELL